ncbi:MAG: hypothetical protein PVJ57_17625 [Phycisphaerae bacterium]|jgi:hypothetical protein
MDGLELVPTEELIAEILRRTDQGLVIWIDPHDRVEMRFHGRHVSAIGLAEYARRRIYEQLFLAQPPPPEIED